MSVVCERPSRWCVSRSSSMRSSCPIEGSEKRCLTAQIGILTGQFTCEAPNLVLGHLKRVRNAVVPSHGYGAPRLLSGCSAKSREAQAHLVPCVRM
jgi:hypothetical protein